MIGGNLGKPDSRARDDLPPDQIQRYVAAFIAEVSSRYVREDSDACLDRMCRCSTQCVCAR